jgi:hypothetical protein
MADLALIVSLILLSILTIGFCFGAFIATKTRPFLTLERVFLSFMWAAPILFLSMWNQAFVVWALIGYVGGSIVFWRKWI